MLAELGRQIGQDPRRWQSVSVGGGSFSRAFRLVGDGLRMFVKLGGPGQRDMFAAEAHGLRALERAAAIRVPQVLALGSAAEASFVALEWLDIVTLDADAEHALGRQLATQHRTTADNHGWERDNTIGATPQRNRPDDDWARFFREHRLRFQLELARGNALPPDAAAELEALLEVVDSLLAGHAPAPSLLHGDLWGGNRGALADGTPVVFDPAVYFGDRETDIAMTRLFGRFGREFYAAYEAQWPLADGWQIRAELYNLYHLLNHFNLFGRSWLSAVRSTAAGLLRAAS